MSVPTSQPGYPTLEQFVEVWDWCDSVTEASVALVAGGHYRMTPAAVRRWVKTWREVGLRIKKAPPSPLPAYQDEPEVVPAKVQGGVTLSYLAFLARAMQSTSDKPRPMYFVRLSKTADDHAEDIVAAFRKFFL